MPIDPNLAHGFQPTQNVGPNLGVMLQNAQQMMQTQEQNRQVRQQNALRGILSAPGAMDDQGNPTDDAMKQVMGIDPAAGMQLRQNMLVQQQRQLQTDAMRSKASQDKMELLAKNYEPLWDDYNDAIKNGATPQEAAKTAQEGLSAANKQMTTMGLLAPHEIANLPTQWDTIQMGHFVKGSEIYRQDIAARTAAEAKARTEAREDETLRERERHDRADEGKTGVGAAAENDAKTIADANIAAFEKQQGRPASDAERAKFRQQARIDPKIAEFAQKQDANAISDEAANLTAEESLRGDWHGTVGMGRNSASMKKIADARARIAKERGITGDQLAANTAEFIGATAAQRVLGTRGAGIELGIAEAQKFAPMVLSLSDKIDRTKYPTLNALELAVSKGTGGEDVIRLTDALNAYKTAYTQILTRGGLPTDDARRRSDEVIDKAWSNGQIRAAVDQLGQEMDAASSAVPTVRDKLYRSLTGKDRPGGSEATGAKQEAGLAKSVLGTGEIATPKTPADLAALPPGTRYRRPGDGPEVYRVTPQRSEATGAKAAGSAAKQDTGAVVPGKQREAAGTPPAGALAVPKAHADDADGTTYNSGKYVKRGGFILPATGGATAQTPPPGGRAIPQSRAADPDGTTYNGGKLVKRGDYVVPVEKQ